MTGKQLQGLREEGGLSQSELARGIGINRATLSLIENGHQELSPKQEAAIRSVILRALRARSVSISKAAARAERLEVLV
jgi:transcriptional regulator with XRE-family HTH domain